MALHAVRELFFDNVLPPLCYGCNSEVGGTGGLCSTCWSKIEFRSSPWCRCCGTPFELAPFEELSASYYGDQNLCDSCLNRSPAYDRLRSAFNYTEQSQDLVLRFKHSDRLDAAPLLGSWLARVGAELLDQADCITPVPLYRWRLFSRRYNQSAVLSYALLKASGRKFPVVIPDILVRQRATKPQGKMGRVARSLNVSAAFVLHPRRRQHVVGRRILIVDDVCTTGSTLEECARVLKRAGAIAVDALTLTIVPKHG